MADKKTKKKFKKLDSMSLNFILDKRGSWTERSQELFMNRVKKKGLTQDEGEIQASLKRAKNLFDKGDVHLFVCCGSSCKKNHKLKLNKKNRDLFREEYGINITKTKCQGPCKKSPVSTLRVGDQCERLYDVVKKKKDLKKITENAHNGKEEKIST